MSDKITDPRALAHASLMAIMKHGRYSNIEIDAVLKNADGLSPADRGLYTRLVYGVIERRITLDYIIKKLSSVAFEKIEAARWLSSLKKGGTVITNSQKISPMPVITGAAQYPEGLLEKIADKGINLIAVDALSAANEAGSAKAVNVVLMGVLSKVLKGFDEAAWKKAVEECVPKKVIEINEKAFELGTKLV